jgi:hypothetical protein
MHGIFGRFQLTRDLPRVTDEQGLIVIQSLDDDLLGGDAPLIVNARAGDLLGRKSA